MCVYISQKKPYIYIYIHIYTGTEVLYTQNKRLPWVVCNDVSCALSSASRCNIYSLFPVPQAALVYAQKCTHIMHTYMHTHIHSYIHAYIYACMHTNSRMCYAIRLMQLFWPRSLTRHSSHQWVRTPSIKHSLRSYATGLLVHDLQTTQKAGRWDVSRE